MSADNHFALCGLLPRLWRRAVRSQSKLLIFLVAGDGIDDTRLFRAVKSIAYRQDPRVFTGNGFVLQLCPLSLALVFVSRVCSGDLVFHVPSRTRAFDAITLPRTSSIRNGFFPRHNNPVLYILFRPGHHGGR